MAQEVLVGNLRAALAAIKENTHAVKEATAARFRRQLSYHEAMRKAAEAEVARLREELAEAKASGEGAREFREAREILRAAVHVPDAPTLALLASAVAEGLLRPDQVMLQYLCDVAWNVHIKTTENWRWSPAVKRLLLSVPPGGGRTRRRPWRARACVACRSSASSSALYIYERCGGDLDVVDSTVSMWGVENEFSEIVSRKYKGRLKNILPVILEVDKALQLKRMWAKERGSGVAESRRKRYELTENAAGRACKRASWSDGQLGLSVRVGVKWAGAVLKKA